MRPGHPRAAWTRGEHFCITSVAEAIRPWTVGAIAPRGMEGGTWGGAKRLLALQIFAMKETKVVTRSDEGKQVPSSKPGEGSVT